MNDAFYYLEHSKTNRSIELWSSKRLPFEAQGWLLEMKERLRYELNNIKGKGYLYANFISNRADFFDVDHVLFYNLGYKTFSDLAVKGLCFERVFQRPPSMSTHKQYPYYSSYQVLKKNKRELWQRKSVTAKWKDILLPPISTKWMPHNIWLCMKQGGLLVKHTLEYHQYGVNLVIHGPIGSKLNLTSIVKPLVEGVISSLHHHNGACIKEVSKMLVDYLDVDKDTIATYLTEEATSVLGERSLVLPYQKGLMWYPNNQLIAYVNIIFKDDLHNEDYTMNGELFGVSCKRVLK